MPVVLVARVEKQPAVGELDHLRLVAVLDDGRALDPRLAAVVAVEDDVARVDRELRDEEDPPRVRVGG